MKKLVILAIYILTVSLTARDALADELDLALNNDFMTTQRQNLDISDIESTLREYQEQLIEDRDDGLFIPLEPSGGELLTAGILGSAAIMVFANDEEIIHFVQNNRNDVTKVISEFGESFGSDLSILGIGAGLVIGVVFKNDKIKRVSIMSVKAMLYSGLVTRVLKTSFGRHRPSEDQTKPYQFDGLSVNQHSFPSGHTTQAFAFATVLAQEFKHIKYLPVLSYTAAAIAGWSRVHGTGNGSPAHWGSDVVAGALIGHFITKQMYNSKLAQRGIMITPGVDVNGTIGMNLRYERRSRSSFDSTEEYCNISINRRDKECSGSIFGPE